MNYSNDWQNIDGLTYKAININTKVHYFWDENTANKLATALNWDVVKLSDFVPQIIAGPVDAGEAFTVSSDGIYMLRPDENCAFAITFTTIIAMRVNESGTCIRHGAVLFDLTTGALIDSSWTSYGSANPIAPVSISILSPLNSAFVIKNAYYDNALLYFDVAYNPKTGVTYWCAGTNRNCLDLVTGLRIEANMTAFINKQIVAFDLGGFVNLQRLTYISPIAILNTKHLFGALIDYDNSSKVIQLDGYDYLALESYMYVRLGAPED